MLKAADTSGNPNNYTALANSIAGADFSDDPDMQTIQNKMRTYLPHAKNSDDARKLIDAMIEQDIRPKVYDKKKFADAPINQVTPEDQYGIGDAAKDFASSIPATAEDAAHLGVDVAVPLAGGVLGGMGGALLGPAGVVPGMAVGFGLSRGLNRAAQKAAGDNIYNYNVNPNAKVPGYGDIGKDAAWDTLNAGLTGGVSNELQAWKGANWLTNLAAQGGLQTELGIAREVAPESIGGNGKEGYDALNLPNIAINFATGVGGQAISDLVGAAGSELKPALTAFLIHGAESVMNAPTGSLRFQAMQHFRNLPFIQGLLEKESFKQALNTFEDISTNLQQKHVTQPEVTGPAKAALDSELQSVKAKLPSAATITQEQRAAFDVKPNSAAAESAAQKIIEPSIEGIHPQEMPRTAELGHNQKNDVRAIYEKNTEAAKTAYTNLKSQIKTTLSPEQMAVIGSQLKTTINELTPVLSAEKGQYSPSLNTAKEIADILKPPDPAEDFDAEARDNLYQFLGISSPIPGEKAEPMKLVDIDSMAQQLKSLALKTGSDKAKAAAQVLSSIIKQFHDSMPQSEQDIMTEMKRGYGVWKEEYQKPFQSEVLKPSSVDVGNKMRSGDPAFIEANKNMGIDTSNIEATARQEHINQSYERAYTKDYGKVTPKTYAEELWSKRNLLDPAEQESVGEALRTARDLPIPEGGNIPNGIIAGKRDSLQAFRQLPKKDQATVIAIVQGGALERSKTNGIHNPTKYAEELKNNPLIGEMDPEGTRLMSDSDTITPLVNKAKDINKMTSFFNTTGNAHPLISLLKHPETTPENARDFMRIAQKNMGDKFPDFKDKVLQNIVEDAFNKSTQDVYGNAENAGKKLDMRGAGKPGGTGYEEDVLKTVMSPDQYAKLQLAKEAVALVERNKMFNTSSQTQPDVTVRRMAAVGGSIFGAGVIGSQIPLVGALGGAALGGALIYGIPLVLVKFLLSAKSPNTIQGMQSLVYSMMGMMQNLRLGDKK